MPSHSRRRLQSTTEGVGERGLSNAALTHWNGFAEPDLNAGLAGLPRRSSRMVVPASVHAKHLRGLQILTRYLRPVGRARSRSQSIKSTIAATVTATEKAPTANSVRSLMAEGRHPNHVRAAVCIEAGVRTIILVNV
jgi:hypothetical protein